MTEKLFWWMKSKPVNELTAVKEIEIPSPLTPNQISEISSSLAEFLEKEQKFQNQDDADTDIGSIIEEINKIAAQSPLGPYEPGEGDRSIEEIIKEAEKVYQDSSKSFEQLSSRSKTSANLSDTLNSIQSGISTPTPKSISPLPLDVLKDQEKQNNNHSDSYSEDFSEDISESNSSPSIRYLSNHKSPNEAEKPEQGKEEIKENEEQTNAGLNKTDENAFEECIESDESDKEDAVMNDAFFDSLQDVYIREEQHEFLEKDVAKTEDLLSEKMNKREFLSEIKRIEDEIEKKEEVINLLHSENQLLKDEMKNVKAHLEETTAALEKNKQLLSSQNLKSPEINLELNKALEELKDTKEVNTVLQLQLEGINQTYQALKCNYEDVLLSNKSLEKRALEAEELLSKYKNELLNLQRERDRLIESETNLNKLLEMERMQNKNLKIQNEKDAKCIQDLNRQIKEMERIIARKHPDSVAALIVAAKNDQTDSNLTARKLLEDRIKALEYEISKRDAQSSKLFLEVQEKFNQMKAKYESHIEDLELHVSDLKKQLKSKRVDCFDMYTQTFFDDQKIPEKETKTVAVQTENKGPPHNLQKIGTVKRIEKHFEPKEETHLLATIRGLQTDLLNKERAIIKLNKEIEELKKTNRRLQKEREGSLRNLAERREFRSYPEKLAVQVRPDSSTSSEALEEELKSIRNERDKMRQQLFRMEEDYQSLKAKRLQDLTTLQEAHEREIGTYLANIAPLQEQLEVQQVTINTLQNQLKSLKEELAIITIERDHLNNRLNSNQIEPFASSIHRGDGDNLDSAVSNKLSLLEKNHIEREQRLRAIVLGLAQKNVMNINCEQCATRQKQLIMYKNELDQIMATLRALN